MTGPKLEFKHSRNDDCKHCDELAEEAEDEITQDFTPRRGVDSWEKECVCGYLVEVTAREVKS